MSFVHPDRYFSRISRISIQRDLLGCGLTHVLLDIDNTILTRDTHEIPRDVMVWLRSAQQAGVDFCLVSNNCHSGVFDLAQEIGLPIVAKSLKPLPHGFLRGRAKIGGCKTDTVVIGDQLSTDIIGANALGMASYLVLPLVDADLRHTLVLRKVERVLLGSRQPEGLDDPEEIPAGAEPAYVQE